MLELCSASITLANLALCGVIGVRILRASGWEAPERWLGLHFVVYQVVASLLSTSLYMGWSDPALALSSGVERGVNGAFHLLSVLGMTSLLVFAQRTFRADAPWARRAVVLGAGLMVASFAGLAFTEGFQVLVLNGFFYWALWTLRLACFLWVAVESLLYWGRMRRRRRIGLAEPLVTNRFLLWGSWATLVSVLACSDPMARFWYFVRAGTAVEWVPEIGAPIVFWVVAFTSAFGMLAALALFLAFFPTAAYRRWVTRAVESEQVDDAGTSP